MKINLGSGPNGIEGWENIDWGLLPFLSKMTWLRKWLILLKLLDKSYDIKWPSIVLKDIRYKLSYQDASVDYIYCSHVLEHFEVYQAEKILRECKRVIKVGGVVRIVVPDLKKMMINYKNADQFCREFFGYSKDIDMGVLSFFVRGHQWMYDVESMTKLLKKVGFDTVVSGSYRGGKFPDINQLDYSGHKKISMYIEASRS